MKPCIAFVDEILAVHETYHPTSELRRYRDYIETICSTVREAGVRFEYNCDPADQRSGVSWGDQISGERGILRWHLLSAKDTEALYDLVHEFGHVLLGRPDPNDHSTYDWEAKAWCSAWRAMIRLHPEIVGHHHAFIARRDKCLSSYR